MRTIDASELQGMSELERSFFLHLVAQGLDRNFVREYVFDENGRKWRFDFADIERKVGVELNGAVFTGGRHTLGAGTLGDYEKLNAAVCQGWRVLQYGSKHFERFADDYASIVKRDEEGKKIPPKKRSTRQ